MSRRLSPLSSCLLLACAHPSPAHPIEGTWQPETYLLADGSRHEVTGRIFFVDGEWTVLFFVLEDGTPVRGSAEGGAYELDGNRLTFHHAFQLAGGERIDGVPRAPDLAVRDAAAAPREPTTVAFDADHMTIEFPSGNSMTFRRVTSGRAADVVPSGTP